MGVIFNSVPVGSLVTVPEEKRLRYIEAINTLPGSIGDIMFSLETGAYLRGLTKSFNLPEEKSSVVAFAVVRVAVGELPFSQLASTLTAELSLPTDRAQSMAQEIEKDLFSAVRQELREYWAKSKRPPAQPIKVSQKPSPPPAAIPPNLLNLKEQPKVISPPPMPPSLKS